MSIVYRYSISSNPTMTGGIVYRLDLGETEMKVWLYAETAYFEKKRARLAVNHLSKTFEPLILTRTTKLSEVEEAVCLDDPDSLIPDLILRIRQANTVNHAHDIVKALHIKESYENHQW